MAINAGDLPDKPVHALLTQGLAGVVGVGIVVILLLGLVRDLLEASRAHV